MNKNCITFTDNSEVVVFFKKSYRFIQYHTAKIKKILKIGGKIATSFVNH